MLFINQFRNTKRVTFTTRATPIYRVEHKYTRGFSCASEKNIFSFNVYDIISTKEYHRFILVKFNITVGTPLMSQPSINAIIGPYGVNMINLQKKLEPLNDLFEGGTKLPIFLKIYGFDRYHVIIKGPSLSYLSEQVKGGSNFLSIYQIYELVRKKKGEPYYINCTDQSIYFSILGFLKSNNKSIIIDHLLKESNTIEGKLQDEG